MNLNLSFAKKAVPLAGAIMLSACATVYTDENFAEYQQTHSEVAIIPFDVIISQKKLPENVELETLEAMQEEEGLNIQKQLYSQYLKRWSKGKYTVKFQDVDETNVLLRRSNMADDNIKNFTKAEIGEALGVDAIISGTIKREKPMGTGAAIASALLLGFGGATNTVNVNMTVHESEDGQLLWSYDHEVGGSLGSSANGITKSLIKATSKKFPYRKED